jgi:hypothetical protein
MKEYIGIGLLISLYINYLSIHFIAITLKVPKREIFVTELFILRDWAGDLRNDLKKPFV